jgi:transposase
MYQELDRDGEVIGSGSGKLTREAVRAFLRERPKGTRVAFEAGGQSGWIRDEVAAAGHEAIVADPRQIPGVTKKRRRTDEVDAANLAHYAWLNPASLHPVQLRPSQQQQALVVIRLRAALVEGRTMLINSTRGLVKLSGDRVAKCDADGFAERAMEQLPAELSATFLPTIQTIRQMTLRIAEYEKVIEEMADRDYPESRYLWQVPSVGKLTALDFILTIGSPDRVAHSRDVGPLLGLVPARRQSGEQDPHLGISKTGDRYLRKLLVQCAQRILGKRGVDSALRRWGLAHVGRTRATKKRAVVAVARKLAVMLHRLWARKEAYQPFPSTDAPPAAANCAA